MSEAEGQCNGMPHLMSEWVEDPFKRRRRWEEGWGIMADIPVFIALKASSTISMPQLRKLVREVGGR